MPLSPFWAEPITPPCAVHYQQALARQGQLTKPPGSLGQLEPLAAQLAAQQGCAQPAAERIAITLFAADHGVCAEGVSAFPQAVTGQMIANFVTGGAAISVLARQLGASLEVVNLGTVSPPPLSEGVIDQPIGPGTANLAQQDAMSEAQLQQALEAGAQAAERAQAQQAQLFIGGEMGIGNTTSASAVACALLAAPARELAGPGTGLDHQGVSHKVQIIEQALRRHGDNSEPLAVLASLGGFEIAALSGAMIGSAQRGIPVLVDGFIVSVAALAACRLNPALRPWLHFAHRSQEPGHGRVLDALDAEPLLALGMRLGEGSGAAIAASLLRSACVLHNQMATFADAGVSDGNS